MESIQSIQKNQLKQTASFICDGWNEKELNILASHRLNYNTSNPQVSNMLLPWNKLKSISLKKDLLIESITEDLVELENTNNENENENPEKDNSQIMLMLNERYGLNKLARHSKKKQENLDSQRFWKIFLVSGLFFFALFFIPFYFKSCKQFCKEESNDCSSISSSCSFYYYFASSFYSSETPQIQYQGDDKNLL